MLREGLEEQLLAGVIGSSLTHTEAGDMAEGAAGKGSFV